jgi:enoyl-CoA hydratase/carnithine racemase
MLRRTLRCLSSHARFEIEPNGLLGVLHLQRPNALNSFSIEMCETIKSAAKIVSDPDSHVRALIISGDDRAFSAGKDLKASFAHTDKQASEYYKETLGAIKPLLDVPIPIIAGIEGACLGLGLELALTADIRIASTSSRIGFPEINLSIFPGCGGAVMLPLILGNISIASDLILTGRQITAQEAKDIGLVSRIVPGGSALDKCMQIAEPLLSKDRGLLIKTKEVVKFDFNRQLKHTNWMNISEQYRTELGKSSSHLNALAKFANRKHR